MCGDDRFPGTGRGLSQEAAPVTPAGQDGVDCTDLIIAQVHHSEHSRIARQVMQAALDNNMLVNSLFPFVSADNSM
jgi:hypothetical protein